MKSQDTTLQKLSFALLLFASALGELTTGIFVPTLPAIGVEFQISNFSLQIIMASFIATLAFSQLLAGPITDYYGRRPVYLWGLATLLLGSCGAGIAEGPEHLLASRILQGLGAAAVYVATRGSIRDTRSEAELPRTMGMLIIAFMLTAVLSPLIGGILLEQLGWRSTFWFLATTIGASLIGALLTFNETIHKKKQDTLTAKKVIDMYRRLFTNKEYMRYATIHSFGYASFYIFVAALPLFGRDVLKIGSAAIGGSLSAITIGMITGVVLASSIAKRTTVNTCIGLGLSFAILGVALFLAFVANDESLDLTSVIATQALAAFGGGLVSPHTSSQTLLQQPKHAGLASAGLGFLSMALAGLGIVVMGYIYNGNYIEVAFLQLAFTAASVIPFVSKGNAVEI